MWTWSCREEDKKIRPHSCFVPRLLSTKGAWQWDSVSQFWFYFIWILKPFGPLNPFFFLLYFDNFLSWDFLRITESMVKWVHITNGDILVPDELVFTFLALLSGSFNLFLNLKKLNYISLKRNSVLLQR